MSEQDLAVATRLLEKLGRQAPVEDFAELVSDDLLLKIPGDATALPWTGSPKTGRRGFTDFIRDQRELVDEESFRVDDILQNEMRTVVLGEVLSKIKKTTRVVQTYFAMIVTISNGKIVRFQFLDDSYAVSQVAR